MTSREWAVFDTVNATIGQGYMLVNPLQQAVMAARIASGKGSCMPRLLLNQKPPSKSWASARITSITSTRR
jgi:penicillin-binding protein 2